MLFDGGLVVVFDFVEIRVLYAAFFYGEDDFEDVDFFDGVFVELVEYFYEFFDVEDVFCG